MNYKSIKFFVLTHKGQLQIINSNIYIYELNNFDHVLGVVSQTRVSGGNQQR